MITDKELIIRLKNLLIQLDCAIDWGQDCMLYAMVEWERKHGEMWRTDEHNAIEAKRELHNLIQQLEHEGRTS